MTNKTAGRTNMRNLNCEQWTMNFSHVVYKRPNTHTHLQTHAMWTDQTHMRLPQAPKSDWWSETHMTASGLIVWGSVRRWWRSLDPRVHITAGQRLTTAGLNHIITAHLSISTVTAQCNKAFNGSITHGIRKHWSVFSLELQNGEKLCLIVIFMNMKQIRPQIWNTAMQKIYYKNANVFTHYWSKVWTILRLFSGFERSLFCSLSLHLFEKYNKNCEILLQFRADVFYVNMCSNVIYYISENSFWKTAKCLCRNHDTVYLSGFTDEYNSIYLKYKYCT